MITLHRLIQIFALIIMSAPRFIHPNLTETGLLLEFWWFYVNAIVLVGVAEVGIRVEKVGLEIQKRTRS